MKDLYNEIELQCARVIDYLSSAIDLSSQSEVGRLHRQLLTAIEAQMSLLYEKFEPLDQVTGDEVSLSVMDTATGRIFTRELPMDYQENDNGITLKGETLEGKPSSMVFLSNSAESKITDLTGHGLNQPRCNHDS